jgi:hypothetical protein
MKRDGIRVTKPPRTMIDLAPNLGDRATGRMFREALRLRLTTASELAEALDRHPRRPGTTRLRRLATRYEDLPYTRTRSDAEGRALEVLHDGGAPAPLVNTTIAREEADLTFPNEHTIIEIDGPQFHQFPDEDARKQALWEAAGFTVRRIPSDQVYNDPNRLLELIEPATRAAQR